MCELCLLGLRDPSEPHDATTAGESSSSSMLEASKPSLNWDQVADKIATTGWSTAATSPISYAYRSSNSTDPGFARFNAAQIQATELALDLWSDVANISFQRVTSNGTAYSNSATILFSTDTDSGGYGWAYFPGSTSSTNIAGDVFINTSNGWFSDVSPGSYDFTTIIHEIGHSLGLSHPGAYNGGNPTYSNDAEYLQDSNQYTVMSYFDASATGADHGWTSASTPLLHDIAAAQLLYGANMATRATDTTYGFNSNADKAVFRVGSATQDVVFAIWDGGGYDTLDFSGYSDNQVLNLLQEGFSDVGGLTKNVAIALGVVIEKAIGGSGHDILIGNSAANTLLGGAGNDDVGGDAGNDFVEGGIGADIIRGGVGDDNLWGNSSSQSTWGAYVSGTVTADGGDTIYGGDGNDYASGNQGDDRIFGENGNDNVGGGQGNDYVEGGLGSDVINGGFGDDTLWGGSSSQSSWGVYVADTATADGADTIYGGGGRDSINGNQGNDYLDGGSEADVVGGGQGDDTLLGGTGADTLTGGYGIDWLDGGTENDVLTGGAGNDTFWFGPGYGFDTITDFENGTDYLNLSGMAGEGLHGMSGLTIRSVSGGTELSFNTTTILLSGFGGSVDATHVLFA